jgi:hypothetical protein
VGGAQSKSCFYSAPSKSESDAKDSQSSESVHAVGDGRVAGCAGRRSSGRGRTAILLIRFGNINMKRRVLTQDDSTR